MSLTSAAFTAQLNAVAGAKQRLTKAKGQYSAVKSLNGQNGYSVLINGEIIAVAVMDESTYMAKVVRGREMIHLGALKALDGFVDLAKASLKNEQSKLATMARDLADKLEGSQTHESL